MFFCLSLGHPPHQLVLLSIFEEKTIQNHPIRNNKELLEFHFTSEIDKNKLHCQLALLLINLYLEFLNP